MARVPYVSREDLPAEKQSVYDHIEATRGGIDAKEYRTLFGYC